MTNITTQTRKESFEQILGTLGDRQQLILMYMEDGKPTYTASTLAKEMFADNLIPSSDRNAVHPRLNELVKAGLLQVIGKEKDPVTNRKVAVYKLV